MRRWTLQRSSELLFIEFGKKTHFSAQGEVAGSGYWPEIAPLTCQRLEAIDFSLLASLINFGITDLRVESLSVLVYTVTSRLPISVQ
jgi:hypothetical protein